MKPSAIYTSTNVLGASLAYDLVLNRLTNKTPFFYTERFWGPPLFKLGGYSFNLCRSASRCESPFQFIFVIIFFEWIFIFNKKPKCVRPALMFPLYFDRLHIDSSTPSFIINTPQSPCWSCFHPPSPAKKKLRFVVQFCCLIFDRVIIFWFVLTGCVSYLNGRCSHFYCPSPTISEKPGLLTLMTLIRIMN